jgi:hypothetical protein
MRRGAFPMTIFIQPVPMEINKKVLEQRYRRIHDVKGPPKSLKVIYA